jgi:uncharacterized protein (TIGR02117 family)
VRRLIHLATALILLPLLYFAAAGLGALWPGSHANLPSGNDVAIGLLRGPIHYDLLLPLTDELRVQFGFANDAGVPVSNPSAEWLLVGWGARGFYTTVGSYSDLNTTAIWDGVTGDDAVMHLDVAGHFRDLPGLIYLPLSQAQFAALVARINGSFLHDQTGAVIALPIPGLGANDAFFAAKGHFNLLHTCNVWIGETLRAAGVPFGAWTPTPQSVALSLHRFTPARS